VISGCGPSSKVRYTALSSEGKLHVYDENNRFTSQGVLIKYLCMRRKVNAVTMSDTIVANNTKGQHN
jgi:hypothetical protein